MTKATFSDAINTPEQKGLIRNEPAYSYTSNVLTRNKPDYYFSKKRHHRSSPNK